MYNVIATRKSLRFVIKFNDFAVKKATQSVLFLKNHQEITKNVLPPPHKSFTVTIDYSVAGDGGGIRSIGLFVNI